MVAPPQTLFTQPLSSLQVDNLIVTKYASLPGGNASGVAFGGVYTCTGSESPGGFPIAIAGLPASYVAIVQAFTSRGSGGVYVATTNPDSWTASQITVQTALQPNAGDTITYIIAPL